MQFKKWHKLKQMDLTDSEKDQIAEFFLANTYLESKIDWNNSDLSIRDFDEVFSYISKRKASNGTYTIPTCFKEGIDYIDLSKKQKSFQVFLPLTYDFQKYMQNKGFDNICCEWCVGANDNRNFWKNHALHSYVLIVVSLTVKIAVQVKRGKEILYWNAKDKYRTRVKRFWSKITDAELALADMFEKEESVYLQEAKNIILDKELLTEELRQILLKTELPLL